MPRDRIRDLRLSLVLPLQVLTKLREKRLPGVPVEANGQEAVRLRDCLLIHAAELLSGRYARDFFFEGRDGGPQSEAENCSRIGTTD